MCFTHAPSRKESCRGRAVGFRFVNAKMPADHDKRAYPEPPEKTPVLDKQTVVPKPAAIIASLFYYSVDVPVTAFRDAIDSIRAKNRPVYYHQKFRRVPDLTECQEGDYVCYYEAEMQWRRDFKVDQEIVKVVQERMKACHKREGANSRQNCAKELEQFTEVAKNYQSRYGDLGAYASGRKCLMKQKERMIAAQAKNV
ncbi:NADH dehydrogenase [ubiquinone] 1 beta subcomplex subunit 10 isoform X2 [Betta splendens]|uniref:NADH dehydrogenase [ubiquinone] 1 beta subcomplex subunit 10 n=1 Tax=Betta splendens TaxID=158456 RepID=A0A6P7N670_BETSP|nr:NADH dehydrogenase [ubiquinone] 1 beta subcomplex subunit 10 isoform X2 [Betta splendens]